MPKEQTHQLGSQLSNTPYYADSPKRHETVINEKTKRTLCNTRYTTMCTDSRPRPRWYPLQGLLLVGSECVFPQCNSSSLSHGEVPSHLRSAFPSMSQELTRNANRKSGTPVTVNSPTVKCPMVRPQRYSTLQKPISGYQPQVGSDRVALINLAIRTLDNDHVQRIVVSLITI